MSTPAYRLTPAAAKDLAAIVDYLRADNPVAAIRFVEAAQATFEHLCHAPGAYPELASHDPRLAGLRRRTLTGAFSRYIVFYREVARGVDVIRVLHSARDLARILGGDP